MVDWKMDTEKRLNNLLRFIQRDVISRGDASALSDDPRVEHNADGSYTVIVFKSDEPAPVAEASDAKAKTGAKKSSKKE